MHHEATAPRVGVVTVTYNSANVLEDFLDSLSAQQGVEVRLYAVDNDSHDGSVDRLREETRLPHLTVIANTRNAGVAEGNNQGIVAALDDRCDWVLLLNNDTVLPSDLIELLVRNAESDGAKLIASTSESSSSPNALPVAVKRAMRPSSRSMMAAPTIIHPASAYWPRLA